jgi:CBS domain-containing protein
MTPQPTAIASDATVVEPARRMSSENVGSLPVVDSDKLVGMVTDRDLVLHVVARDLDPHKVSVADVCSDNPVVAAPDESLDDAVSEWLRAGSPAAGRRRRAPRRDPRPGRRRAHVAARVDGSSRRGDLGVGL